MPRKKKPRRFNTARAEKASRAQFDLTRKLAKNPPFEVKPAPLQGARLVAKPARPVDYGATITINARDIEP